MSWNATPGYNGNRPNGAGAGETTPLQHTPLMTTTSPTPSPRRTHFPLGAQHLPTAGPSSPRLTRMIPQRMPSDSSDRDTSPGIDSPSRRTNLVMGFSPGTGSSPLPSVNENSATSTHQLHHISSITSPLARMPSQLTTPVESTFPSGIQQYGSPGLSPRRLPADLPGSRSRRNSAAPVSISLRSRSRSGTPRGSRAGLPTSSNNSGQATPSRGSETVTPKGEGSDRGSGKRPVLVQMGSTSSKRQDSWTPDFHFDMEDQTHNDDWTPAGGMLLGDEDEQQGRSWTSMTDDTEDIMSRPIFAPGDQFGEGLLFQGDMIVPAIGRAHGHDIDHPLRRGGSEIGMTRRNGPVGMGATDGRERRKTVYEIVKAAGEGSFAQVYHIREKGGKRRDYALKIVGRPALSEDQYENQLFEAQIHLSLPIHTNIVTLHETLQTDKWLFLMLEWCPGDDLFYWLENNKNRTDKEQAPNASSPPPNSFNSNHILSSSKISSSTIPFSPGAMFHGLAAQHPHGSSFSSSISGSPFNAFAPSSHNFGASPAASMIFSQNNHQHHHHSAIHLAQTPPTPSLLSAFSANTLLRADRLRLIASMFSQMCEAVAVCHDIGVSHRDIKPENFICCDSVELETVHETIGRGGSGFGSMERDGDGDDEGGFGPQAKRKVIVKLTDFGLATTLFESEDMLCGSKPYMSYECRNNVGPNYQPGPADVWSLGIVLLNMIFHRSCWSEPTYDDSKFADFVDRPKEHLMARFTGIGDQVASFLATHVLCLDVGDRVSARDFGKWVKNLPEMMAGKAAVKEMRSVAKEARLGEKGLFAKSPIGFNQARKSKPSASALTTTAPAPMAPSSFQGLSSLPPPSQLQHTSPPTVTKSDMPPPDLVRDVPSASTVDERPTPVESADLPSPGSSEVASPTGEHDMCLDDQARSTSTQQKRRKRGVRKGKAAQAALAAENPKPTEPEREALLSELAQASQSLARDLSKSSRTHVDTTSPDQFPPLGTSPAQLAQAKRSKWRDMLSFSSTADNPELAALARRVAERESGGTKGKGGFGNWSAPAKMQDDHRSQLSGRPSFKQTNTMSTSGVDSQLSSFGGVPAMSSATSSNIEEEPEDLKGSGGTGTPEVVTTTDSAKDKESQEAEDARLKKAVQAAAALSSNLGAMGSFGSRPQHVPRHGPLHGRNLANPRAPAPGPTPAPVSAPGPTPTSSIPITQSPPHQQLYRPKVPQPYQQPPQPHQPQQHVPIPVKQAVNVGRFAKSPPRTTPLAVFTPSSASPARVKSAVVTKTTVESTTTTSTTASSSESGTTVTITTPTSGSSTTSKAPTTTSTSTSAASTITTNANAEPISNERQGKLKGQMQFLNKFMQGVKLSNKKE